MRAEQGAQQARLLSAFPGRRGLHKLFYTVLCRMKDLRLSMPSSGISWCPSWQPSALHAVRALGARPSEIDLCCSKSDEGDVRDFVPI